MFPLDTARVIGLEQSDIIDPFTLSCTSFVSPPTNVIWTKDGTIIDTSNTTKYTQQQVLIARATAMYTTTLTINDSGENLIGTYSCSVSNVFGTSNSVTTNFKRKRFSCRAHFDLVVSVELHFLKNILAVIDYSTCRMLSCRFHSLIKVHFVCQ